MIDVMNDHVQQAAGVIAAYFGDTDDPLDAAVGLADAGLLVTPEMRAVLDAAEDVRDRWRDRWAGDLDRMGAPLESLVAAVDALRAATPKDGE